MGINTVLGKYWISAIFDCNSVFIKNQTFFVSCFPGLCAQYSKQFFAYEEVTFYDEKKMLANAAGRENYKTMEDTHKGERGCL